MSDIPVPHHFLAVSALIMTQQAGAQTAIVQRQPVSLTNHQQQAMNYATTPAALGQHQPLSFAAATANHVMHPAMNNSLGHDTAQVTVEHRRTPSKVEQRALKRELKEAHAHQPAEVSDTVDTGLFVSHSETTAHEDGVPSAGRCGQLWHTGRFSVL